MKLIGYVDGIEVIFDFYPPNKFKAEIPKRIDGTYIVELHAIDDANNISNYSNIFIRIDFNKLKVEMLSPTYFVKSDDSKFEYIQLFNNFVSKPKENIFSYKKLDVYKYRELVI